MFMIKNYIAKENSEDDLRWVVNNLIYSKETFFYFF